MSRFDVVDTPIAGVKVLHRKPMGDERGFLERLYCADDLQPVLGSRSIVQINRTLTEREGTLRGLHFQRGDAAETKVITCSGGRVFDVAVDLRKGSPTYGQHYGLVLEGHVSFVIPEGVAHGFQTLTDACEMLYLHTAAYDAIAEGGLNPLDTDLAIAWPLPVGQMSARDKTHPDFSAFEGLNS